MIQTMKPGPTPAHRAGRPRASLCGRDVLDTTLDRLRSDERTLHLDDAQTLLKSTPGARVVWVIDQLEEVFTLCRDEQSLRFLP